MYALSDSKPPNLPICVNAEAFSRLTDPRRIDFYRVSCILDHHFSSTTNTTTTPHHRFVGMLAFITPRSLPRTGTFSAVDGSTPLGSMDLPQFSTLFFTIFLHKFLPVTKWCCLGSRACFRFSLPSLLSSCIILTVFISLLCHQSRHRLPPTTTIHRVHAEVFAFAVAAARCLHHHKFSRQPEKPAISSPRHSNIPTPLSTLCAPPSLSRPFVRLLHTPGHRNFLVGCCTTCFLI